MLSSVERRRASASAASASAGSRRYVLPALAALALTASPLEGQRWAASLRYYLNWGGPGSRAGDIPGYGAAVSRSLGGSLGAQWNLGVSVDRFEYDLETPVHATGVETAVGDEVDAFTLVTRAQVELARRFRLGSRWTPFLSAGLGVYVIDVPEISGNAANGGTYVLRTESPTTAGVAVAAGSEWRLFGPASFALTLSYAQTFSDYTVTEVGSGARGTISPFSPLGLGAQLVFRW